MMLERGKIYFDRLIQADSCRIRAVYINREESPGALILDEKGNIFRWNFVQ